MRPYRVLALVVVLAAAFAGQSLVVRSAQSAGDGSAGPFDTLHFRPIGPASMSGRISDLAVYEANPSIFYVGTAHGGVWKTINNGTTFEAQFQDQGLMSIGDVTISQNNPDLVWVGTGESNNRQSTSWGDGVYKSTDGGKTYTNMGLKTSRHINRIVIDPRNTDIVFVAATGSLWGPGGERGVYKTTDGGRTWKQVLKVDDDTGANDLVMDAHEQPDPLCDDVSAAAHGVLHERRRSGQRHLEIDRRRRDVEAAEGRRHPGRSARTHRARRVSPPAEHPLRAHRGAGAAPAGRGGRGGGAAEEAPAQAPGGRPATRPTGGQRRAAPTGLYRSDDAGATWRKVNNANPRPMYFSQVRVDPNDPEVVDLRRRRSAPCRTDGGKTVNTARRVEDSLRSSRDLDQPGQLEPRPDRQRRRPGGQLGPGEDLELPARTCRSASSIT